jgi:hypothetical protein
MNEFLVVVRISARNQKEAKTLMVLAAEASLCDDGCTTAQFDVVKVLPKTGVSR